jgi:glycosyltransferase involved in cell wall biosynthesis
MSSERIHFIPNGVDSSRYQPNADTSWWRKELNVQTGEKIVLCPRRLAKKNGVSYFVRAAILLLREGLADTKFVISGDFEGPRVESEEALVAKLIADSGLGTHFCPLGRVENKDMPGLYASSDLVVMPSLIEATSLSAMEAMAASKPIVSTNVGGLPFLVRDGENGFLVQPRQETALAEAMKRLLNSPEKRAEFGQNGRARVEMELDWKIIARRTKEIYEMAIERHGASERVSTATAVH